MTTKGSLKSQSYKKWELAQMDKPGDENTKVLV